MRRLAGVATDAGETPTDLRFPLCEKPGFGRITGANVPGIIVDHWLSVT